MKTKKIEVWDKTGKISEIESGEGTNLTFDDAGNIIVRLGTFPNPFVDTKNEMRIIPADGSAPVDLTLSGITKGRSDFWGHVKGNVLDKTTGGILYTGTQWHPQLIEMPIIDGKQNKTDTYTYIYSSPFGVSGNFATTSIISSWDNLEEIAILSPLYNKTNCNSIQKLVMDDEGNWVHDSYYITPRHSGCAGFYIFAVGTKKYIVYPSGSNNADGFTISELATKATSDIEGSDELVRQATKYSEQKEDDNPMYVNNAFYGNHLSAEAISDTEAYIYQYYPNGYIAQYKFTVKQGSVEDVTDENQAKVIGGNGEINIEGEVSAIEVYTLSGSLISKNENSVKCAPGIYIVKTDNDATKVIVK